MATEKILLQVELDAKSAEAGVKKLNERLGLLKQKATGTKQVFGENSTQLVRVNARMKETSASIRKQERDLINMNKAAKSARGSYDQLSATYSVMKTRLNAMSAAERSGTKAGKALEKQARQTYQQMDKLQKQTGKASLSVGGYAKGLLKSAVAMGGAYLGVQALVGVFKNISRIVTEFSSAQSKLASVLGVTKSEISDLADESKRLGSETRYTAAQVAQLQTELAKLGFTSNEIKDATGSILAFATATGSDLPTAAKISGSALRAFGLDATEMERVTSTLAVATARSALKFEDYETSLSKVAPVARAFGFSIEDSTALLGKLADAGFDASTAATSTRNIILNLADSNGALAKALGRPVKNLDELAVGLKELDAKGVDLATTLKLTDKRSVAAFNTFLKGSDGLVDLRDNITDVNKELYDMVNVMEDNLTGDKLKLTSAWEGFILALEDGNGPLSKAARGFTQLGISITEALISLAKGRDELKAESDKLRFGAQAQEDTKEFKAYVKAIEEGTGKTYDLIKAQQNFLKTDRARLKENVQKLKDLDDEFTKQEEINKQKRISGEIGSFESARLNRELLERTKNSKRALKEENKILLTRIASVKQYVGDSKTVKTVTEDTTEATKEGAKEQKKAAKEQKKAAKEKEKADKKAAKDAQKAVDALAKARKDLDNIIYEEGLTVNQLIKKKYDDEFQLLLDKNANVLESERLTAEQVAEYRAFYNAQANDEIKKSDDKIKEDKAAKDEKEKETNKATAQKKIDTNKEYADKSIEALSAINDFTNALNERETQELEVKANDDLEKLNDKLESGLISEEKYAARKSDIELKLDKDKAEIERKAAIRGKALAIAQAGIDTAAAIIKMLANPGGPTGVALSILAGITGAASVAAIAATPLPKASRGYEAKGKTHAQGGIPIEIEDKESVINARSTQLYKPLLSAINVAGGGVPFTSERPKFAVGGIPTDGGFASRSVASGGSLGMEIQRAISNIKIYTAVTDINRGQVNYAKIQGAGRI